MRRRHEMEGEVLIKVEIFRTEVLKRIVKVLGRCRGDKIWGVEGKVAQDKLRTRRVELNSNHDITCHYST